MKKNLSSTPLSEEQIQSFRDNGYLIVRGLASADEVSQLRQLAEADLAAGRGLMEYEADVHYPGSPPHRQAPGGDTVRRLRQAYSRHPEFSAWAMDARISQRLVQLFAHQELYLVQSHHNCVMTKHPRYSSVTSWHQDSRYWAFQSPDLISVWLALGHEEQANGGIYVIPGTHRLQFESHRYDEEKFLRTDLDENKALIEQAVLSELWAGDVLFFHAGLFHAAGRNLTRRRKFALVYTYRTADNPPKENSKSTKLPEVAVPLDHDRRA